MSKDYKTEYANDFKSLDERYNGVEDYIKGMTTGEIRSLIVNGPPGVGKTHSVKAYLEKHIGSTNFKLMNGHCTLLSLYAKLYDFREQGKVVVLDDVDSVFSKTDGLNILKAAMDTTEQRTIHWESPTHHLTTMDVPKSFEYNGSVILISNIGFGGGSNKLTAHLNALKDRSYYSHIADAGVESSFVQICYMVIEKDIFTSLGVPKEHHMMLLEYIDENKKRLTTLSLRTVVKLSTIFRMNPKEWKRMANQGMLKA